MRHLIGKIMGKPKQFLVMMSKYGSLEMPLQLLHCICNECHSAITVFFCVNSVHWLEREIAFGWKFQCVYKRLSHCFCFSVASFFHVTRALVGRYSSFLLTVKRSTIWFLCGFSAAQFTSHSHEIPVKKTNAIFAVDSPMWSMNRVQFSALDIVFSSDFKSQIHTVSHWLNGFTTGNVVKFFSGCFYCAFLEISLI